MSAFVLIVLGGLLQLAGVAMVFCEVVQVTNRVKAFIRRPIMARTFPMESRASVIAIGTVEGPSKTVEERVELLEKATSVQRCRQLEDDDKLRGELIRKMEERDRGIAAGAREDLNEVAQLVLDLQPTQWWRNWAVPGAVSISIGIILSMLGSLLYLRA